jgi:hypothetical protein
MERHGNEREYHRLYGHILNWGYKSIQDVTIAQAQGCISLEAYGGIRWTITAFAALTLFHVADRTWRTIMSLMTLVASPDENRAASDALMSCRAESLSLVLLVRTIVMTPTGISVLFLEEHMRKGHDAS